MTCRILRQGDEPAVERFLAARAETSMFLRSNLRRAGIEDRGESFQATFAGAFEGDALVGVVAHCWNGIVLLQAPLGLAEALRLSTGASGRSVAGLTGPLEQVEEAIGALGLDPRAAKKSNPEELFDLRLDALVVPPALASGKVRCRVPAPADRARLVAWRAVYLIETMGMPDGPEVVARAAAELDRFSSGGHFVLEDGGEVVSYSAFNARLPDIVQIGGVFTPPELRGRGYARAVVAGSLVAARSEGVSRSVLFTADDNVSAQAAYRAIGFQRIGRYGLVLF